MSFNLFFFCSSPSFDSQRVGWQWLYWNRTLQLCLLFEDVIVSFKLTRQQQKQQLQMNYYAWKKAGTQMFFTYTKWSEYRKIKRKVILGDVGSTIKSIQPIQPNFSHRGPNWLYWLAVDLNWPPGFENNFNFTTITFCQNRRPLFARIFHA